MINAIKNPFKSLDALRGFAALYVLIHHARLLLTQPYYEGFLKNRSHYNLIDTFFVYAGSIFKFGHDAVILFFVLSGFVIHLNQAGKTNRDSSKLNIKAYLLKRTIRIYPTLIVALILTFVLDYIIYVITGNRETIRYYSFISLWRNILLIPEYGSWGTNFPLWSLKHEWFFYLIYPLLFILNRKGYLLVFIFSVGLFGLYISGIIIPLIDKAAYTLLVWWLGAFLAEVYYQRLPIKIKHLYFLIPIGTGLLFTPLNKSVEFHDLISGLIITGVIAVLISVNTADKKITHYLSFFGIFSYSIYLLHFPIMNFGKNLIIHYSKMHMLPFHYWYAISGTIISLGIIYPLYLITEKPTQKLKAKLFYQNRIKH